MARRTPLNVSVLNRVYKFPTLSLKVLVTCYNNNQQQQTFWRKAKVGLKSAHFCGDFSWNDSCNNDLHDVE
jgi:hypothetical protein